MSTDVYVDLVSKICEIVLASGAALLYAMLYCNNQRYNAHVIWKYCYIGFF